MSGVDFFSMFRPASDDLAGGGRRQSHDGTERRCLARAVATEQHCGLAFRHNEVDAMQDVILPDMGVDVGEGQHVAHAAVFPGAMPR